MNKRRLCLQMYTRHTVTHLAEVSSQFCYASAMPIAGIQIVRKTTEKKAKQKEKKSCGGTSPRKQSCRSSGRKKKKSCKINRVLVPSIIFILVRPLVRATKSSRLTSLDRGSGRLLKGSNEYFFSSTTD